MLLSEVIDSVGDRVFTWLTSTPRGLVLVIGKDEGSAQRLPVPAGAVQAVMARYGRPASGDVEAMLESLELGIVLDDGGSLSAFRFQPRYDVFAKQYLAWQRPGEPALVELAVSVSAALTHLALALKSKSPPNQG